VQGPEVLAYNGLPDPPLVFTDEKMNHGDDIWALSFGYPHLIASGDYSGRLLVWNINSGRVVATLKVRPLFSLILSHAFCKLTTLTAQIGMRQFSLSRRTSARKGLRPRTLL